MVKKVANPNSTLCKRTNRKFWKGLRILIHKRRGAAVKISELTKASGVFRSTFYNHYDNINELMIKTEERIIKEFKETVLPIAENSTTLHVVLFRLFIFIREYKDYFQALFDLESHRLIVHMFKELRPIITKNWTNYGNGDQIYHVYSHEVSAIIMLWYKDDNFSKNAIDKYVSQVAYLTRYANTHLKGLPKAGEENIGV